jgi:hypothetical protein
MNIYEDETLEHRLDEISDQLGLLLLDFLRVSLKKISHEHIIFAEFEDCRRSTDKPNTEV